MRVYQVKKSIYCVRLDRYPGFEDYLYFNSARLAQAWAKAEQGKADFPACKPGQEQYKMGLPGLGFKICPVYTDK